MFESSEKLTLRLLIKNIWEIGEDNLKTTQVPKTVYINIISLNATITSPLIPLINPVRKD